MTIAVIHLDAPGYCECGCGAKTRIAGRTEALNGSIAGKPRRFVVGHATRGCPMDFIEDPNTGCWMWTLSRNKNGYGQIRLGGAKGRPHLAYRVLYEELVGPVPAGLELDHLCRTPACVNPGHLEPVTHRENMLRGANFAAVNAAKTHCPKGHPYDRDNTTYAGGSRECRACIRERSRLRRKAVTVGI